MNYSSLAAGGFIVPCVSFWVFMVSICIWLVSRTENVRYSSYMGNQTVEVFFLSCFALRAQRIDFFEWKQSFPWETMTRSSKWNSYFRLDYSFGDKMTFWLISNMTSLPLLQSCSYGFWKDFSMKHKTYAIKFCTHFGQLYTFDSRYEIPPCNKK